MNKSIKNLTLSAMFLALGQVLPLITGHIQTIGQMLCPMHIPVLLCGFFCGWQYGMVVGFVCPLLRFLIFGMPPLYPAAIGMAFELAAYGFLAGIISTKLGKEKIWKIYTTLIIAMIGGRIVWGIARVMMLWLGNTPFGFSAFIAGAFIDAIPGIILQLVLIPILVRAIRF